MMDTQKLSPSFSCPIRRYVPSLPREAMKKAETELNETDELREKCIIKLRNWIETRPDLGLMDIGKYKYVITIYGMLMMSYLSQVCAQGTEGVLRPAVHWQ